MKEITRIINAQVTIIESMKDEEADNVISSKEHFTKFVENTFRNNFNTDDVRVEVKDFVLDKDDDPNQTDRKG